MNPRPPAAGVLVVGYLAAVAEIVLEDVWTVGAIRPDLLALLAAGYAGRAGGGRGIATAGAIGLAADLLGSGRLGISLAGFAIAASLMLSFRDRWPRHRALGALGWLAAGVFLTSSLTGLIGWIAGQWPHGLGWIAAGSPATAIVSAAIAAPWVLAAAWLRAPLVRSAWET